MISWHRPADRPSARCTWLRPSDAPRRWRTHSPCACRAARRASLAGLDEVVDDRRRPIRSLDRSVRLHLIDAVRNPVDDERLGARGPERTVIAVRRGEHRRERRRRRWQLDLDRQDRRRLRRPVVGGDRQHVLAGRRERRRRDGRLGVGKRRRRRGPRFAPRGSSAPGRDRGGASAAPRPVPLPARPRRGGAPYPVQPLRYVLPFSITTRSMPATAASGCACADTAKPSIMGDAATTTAIVPIVSRSSRRVISFPGGCRPAAGPPCTLARGGPSAPLRSRGSLAALVRPSRDVVRLVICYLLGVPILTNESTPCRGTVAES